MVGDGRARQGERASGRRQGGASGVPLPIPTGQDRRVMARGLSGPVIIMRHRMQRIIAMGWVAGLIVCAGTGAIWADDDTKVDVEGASAEVRTRVDFKARPGGDEKKFRDFAEVTRGAERHDGLFTL